MIHSCLVCVCVCTVWRDVKLLHIILYYIIYCWGSPGSRGGRWSTKTPPRDLCKRTSGTVVVHLGAFKSQLVATTVPYIYIYIYLTNLTCMSQDSVPVGSYNDPFLSSVISMVTPTWCHGPKWGNLLCGVNAWQTWLPNSHILYW